MVGLGGATSAARHRRGLKFSPWSWPNWSKALQLAHGLGTRTWAKWSPNVSSCDTTEPTIVIQCYSIARACSLTNVENSIPIGGFWWWPPWNRPIFCISEKNSLDMLELAAPVLIVWTLWRVTNATIFQRLIMFNHFLEPLKSLKSLEVENGEEIEIISPLDFVRH